jgi:hypothetical protein
MGVNAVEPAWFVPKERSYDALAQRLLSDSSPPQSVAGRWARNSETYRLTAILDNKTGKVHLVSTFENNREARVTKFTDQPGRAKSLPLREVLIARTGAGGRRYEVIGSARTRDLTEYHCQTFRNRKEFRDQFACELQRRTTATQSAARAVQLMIESRGVEWGGEFDGDVEQETHRAENEVIGLEEIAAPEVPAEPGAPDRLQLDPRELRVLLRDLPPFEDIDDLIKLVEAKNSEGQLRITDALYAVIEKILGQDPYFFTRVLANGLPTVLKDCGLTD